jgi:hypothetical protein
MNKNNYGWHQEIAPVNYQVYNISPEVSSVRYDECMMCTDAVVFPGGMFPTAEKPVTL